MEYIPNTVIEAVKTETDLLATKQEILSQDTAIAALETQTAHLVEKISGLSLERVNRITNLGCALRLGPQQYPKLYGVVQEAAAVLARYAKKAGAIYHPGQL